MLQTYVYRQESENNVDLENELNVICKHIEVYARWRTQAFRFPQSDAQERAKIKLEEIRELLTGYISNCNV